MRASDCRRLWGRRFRASLWAHALVLSAAVCACAVLHAAEPAAVLVVPASNAVVHVGAVLPPEVKAARLGAWQLVEVGQPATAIPAQMAAAVAADGTAQEGRVQLVASIPPRQGAEEIRKFRLRPVGASAGDKGAGFRFQDVSDVSLGLWEGETPVLVYNHGMVTVERVPAKDSRRTRACYIHPLWGLQGEVLTDDAPGDHTHHRGVFWAWPHITIDGREYDLWVYNNIKQKFVGWLAREAGPVAATLGVENGWFVGDKKVMIERVWMRTYRAGASERALDIEFTLTPVDKPVTLVGAPGKSYGGLNARYAPREKTLITVPSGPTKQDLPDTPLAWADLTAKFKDQNARSPSGAAVFVDPGHPDYPPTWLTRHYGILCVGWPGVKGKTFEPDKPIRLCYRIWIHKSAADTETLKDAYDAYAAGHKAEWKPED